MPLERLGRAFLGAAGPAGRASAASLLNNRLRLAEAQRQTDLEIERVRQEKKVGAAQKTWDFYGKIKSNKEAWSQIPPEDQQRLTQFATTAASIIGLPEDAADFVTSQAEEVKTRSVQTVNERGQNVTKIVPDVAGGEYAAQPPKPDKPKGFQKGKSFLVDGQPVESRFNSDSGQHEVPDGQGGFRPIAPGEKAITSSTKLEVRPDGTIAFSQGRDDNTTATNSALQGEQIKGEELALEAKNLLRNLTAEDVGLRGVLGEVFIDRGIGQIFSSVANKDRAKNRQGMRSMREKGLRLMTTDSRFNLADRQAVEKLFPSDGVFESLPNAQQKIIGFGDIIKERVAFSAGKLGRKSFVDMTPREIKAAVADGSLDQGTALRALRLFHGFGE